MFAHKHPSYSLVIPIWKDQISQFTRPLLMSKLTAGQGRWGGFIKIKKSVVIYTAARISYQQECKQLTEIFNAKSWKLKFLLGYIWY